MIGVSPAYFFSRYTTEFHLSDYIDGLDWLANNGFSGFQTEIYKKEHLDEWYQGARELAAAAEAIGLSATQCVGHFLHSCFSNEDMLLSNAGTDELMVLVEIMQHFPGCMTITVPISQYSVESSHAMNSTHYHKLIDALWRKLLSMDEIVKKSGLRLALEILPGSLLGGTEGFLRFVSETGNSTIGYNFDTGHAFSSKECVQTIPAKLAGRIYGTHLKDNFGNENLALPPGRGAIPWDSLINALLINGYEGSFDLEIASRHPEDVFEDYLQGKNRILSALDASMNKQQKEEKHI